jgi:hypothetical protein
MTQQDEGSRELETLTASLPLSLVSVKPLDWYKHNILLSDAERQRARECSQKSDEWQKFRSNRITGSRFAVPLGHSYPYAPEKRSSKPVSFKKALCEFLWPQFVGNCSVKWGEIHEDDARMVAEVVVRQRLEEQFGADNIERLDFDYPGTIVIKGAEWVSVSVDGLLTVTFKDRSVAPEHILLEFKCPYSKSEFYKDSEGDIPLYYFDQIQGSMGFLRMDGFNIKRCFFGVWLKEKTQMSEFAFEVDYFDNVMLPWLKSFYFVELLPRCVLKDIGVLPNGEVQLAPGSCQELSVDEPQARPAAPSRSTFTRPAATKRPDNGALDFCRWGRQSAAAKGAGKAESGRF